MFQEINAAIEYLVTLLHPCVNTTGFKQQAHTSLEARFTNLWFPSDPVRGSASRVVLWHGHGGGEGRDDDLVQACFNNCQKNEKKVEEDFFSMPFTLWIDPNCVAIRLGHGPGINLPSLPVSFGSIQIIYGHRNEHLPQSSSPLAQPPMVTLSPSTPALYQGPSITNRPVFLSYNNNQYHHTRSPASSIASSMNGSRSSSYMSSMDDGEQCPSLTATSSAYDSDSELSIEDMIESGCYKNFDIIDDEEEEQLINVGDGTITSSTNQAKTSIVNYDGGNVGVLGGGIRLGSKKEANQQSTLYSLALPSPNTLQGFEQSLGFPAPTDSSYMMMDSYAIPMTKRIRSRGRRSRGRGAGRAARRQAAAPGMPDPHHQQQQSYSYYHHEQQQQYSHYHQPIHNYYSPPLY